MQHPLGRECLTEARAGAAPEEMGIDGGEMVRRRFAPIVRFAIDSALEGDGFEPSVPGDLSRIAGTSVIAPTTAFTYKGKDLGAKQIGRELGVG